MLTPLVMHHLRGVMGWDESERLGRCEVTVLRGLFPTLPMSRLAMQNLVLSVVFLVALGVRGGPVG